MVSAMPDYSKSKGYNTLVVEMVDSIGIHEHAIWIVLRSQNISNDWPDHSEV